MSFIQFVYVAYITLIQLKCYYCIVSLFSVKRNDAFMK